MVRRSMDYYVGPSPRDAMPQERFADIGDSYRSLCH